MNLINRVKTHFNPTVDSLLANFNKTVEKLHDHADRSNAKAAKLRDQAAELYDTARVHAGQATRARRAALNLSELLV